MDREKIVRELEECASRGGWSHCPECTYKGTSPILICRGHIEAILSLLKKQEEVSIKCITKRTLDDDSYDEPVYSNDIFYNCPHCEQRLSRTYPNKDIKYCWKCGQAVKWDD